MLKKKDGSEYRLVAPNPIMNTQILWDEFKTHNMRWKTEKEEVKKAEIPMPSFEPETFLSALDKAQIEETPVLEEEFSRKEIVHEDLQRKEEIEEDNEIEKVFIHCLPAKIREKKDSLYEESYKTIQYGAPISFEGVILKEADLAIEIWTDTNHVTVGSVIYPKLGSKRWWKIQERTQKIGGWSLLGVPSSYQPSFG